MISLGQDRSTGVQPDVCLLCSVFLLLCSVFLVLCSVLCIVISFGHDGSSGEVALKISTGAMCVSSPMVYPAIPPHVHNKNNSNACVIHSVLCSIVYSPQYITFDNINI